MKQLHPLKLVKKIFSALLLLLAIAPLVHAEKTRVAIQADAPGKPISPDLFGIFFEDLSYAADGGLYAELVQNRSFEYTSDDSPKWNALTAWELVKRGDAEGTVAVDSKDPIHPNNPHYAVLTIQNGDEGIGLQNEGDGGIPLKAGDSYDISLFARQLGGTGTPWIIRLENKSGDLLGETELSAPTSEWKKYSSVIQVKQDADDGRLIVLTKGTGQVAVDMISLFPQKTFHNRPNGLRLDLAQTIADLKPKFMRFPGGCLVHGDGLGNIYRWKDTIGPVEERRGQRNIWNYHQSVGLGFFEYFQFCEDIGAKPLPIVAAGVCCQNSDYRITHKYGIGQKGIPMEEMPAYIQDILDLIEWANGPVNSTWGAKRAAAGHPEPFHLEYLGIGNEDKITPVFKERFKMIYDAVRAKHPEITVVGTVGPDPAGPDYEGGWKIADELKIPIVDEHCYKSPQWFLENLKRYDAYDRSRSQVYLGEFASFDDKRRSTLRSAIAEAAYMTGFERNGDVVHMASYAPLLAKVSHTHWSPDLIYFTNTQVLPTINYYVQKMFSNNSGDTWLPITVTDPAGIAGLAVSAVRDSKTNDVILKFVNYGDKANPLDVSLSGTGNLSSEAVKTVLTGDPLQVNYIHTTQPLMPETSSFSAGSMFDYEAPAHSVTVIRIKGQK